MMTIFLYLMPALAGISMAVWLRHVRQAGGYRWIAHWLASLVPVGALLASLPVAAQVPDLLFMALLSLGAAGAVAFIGGGLYLVLASGPVQNAGASLVESFREAVNSPSANGALGQLDLTDAMKTGFGSVGAPTTSNDEEWDWDNNKHY